MSKRRRMSAQECAQQWHALWELETGQLHRTKLPVANEDPFDCSSLISGQKQLIEREVDVGVSKWRALDERKVKKASVGWSACKIRLPLNFDYLSKLDAPPSSRGGERVVSLVNPTETESYEAELWNIFKATRTIQELKRECGLHQTVAVKDHLDKTDTSRGRVNDRHGLPPPDGPLHTTIFLEVWRRSLKEKLAVDSNRMVLEFLGSQTLLDVHTAIQELTENRLWTGGNSGLLFIEDCFYTTGDVDYATPIINWLKEAPSRSSYLGIADELEIKPMDSIKLNDLRWSLNTRYLHMHQGCVESSLFLIDICLTPKHTLPYPIIHDIWTPTYSVVLCEGCKSRSAILVTPPTCQDTDGAAQICQSCHDALFGDHESHAMDIHIFKQQQDVIPPGDANGPL
jgi:snRNA-activating protein complex (SNAPc), subunit 3